MPNMYVEISGNQQRYSEGVHMRCNLVNDTALTYGFAIRGNVHRDPPPNDYFGDAEWEDTGLGPESGGQITVSATCTAGLVEAVEDEEEGEDKDDAGDAPYNWLVVVAKGATALLLAQLGAIAKLSESGAAQLATDFSHWSKVLEAGQMGPGPVLQRAIALLQMKREELAAQTASPGGATDEIEDESLVKTVQRLRQEPVSVG